MLEFKLQMYFEEYKDSVVISTSAFKSKFIKKHGNFELLNELINMILKYQHKTYGSLVGTGNNTYRLVKKGTYGNLESKRIHYKLGSKQERINRKLREAHK